MKLYRAAPVNAIPAGRGAPAGEAGLASASQVIAIRAADLVSPCGRALAGGDRTALVVAGTPRIRTGDQVVFVKVVAAGRRWSAATARSRPAGIPLITPGSAQPSSSSMSCWVRA